MTGYLAKVIVIFLISAVGAGVQLWSSWPVKLKATPEQPPALTLTIPDAPSTGSPSSEGEAAPEQPDEPENTSLAEPIADPIDDPGVPEPAPAGRQIVLDSLEIDLATTRALFENNLATFIDARPTAEYEAGHIADSMNITPQMLESSASLFALDVIDPAKVVVIYCGGGDCDDSHRVAELLQDLRGFEQTHVFVDGFPAWEAAELPTASGPDPWAE